MVHRMLGLKKCCGCLNHELHLYLGWKTRVRVYAPLSSLTAEFLGRTGSLALF